MCTRTTTHCKTWLVPTVGEQESSLSERLFDFWFVMTNLTLFSPQKEFLVGHLKWGWTLMLAHELSGELQEEMWIDRSRAARHSAAGDLVLKAVCQKCSGWVRTRVLYNSCSLFFIFPLLVFCLVFVFLSILYLKHLWVDWIMFVFWKRVTKLIVR